MTRETVEYDAAAERFLDVESALNTAASSPAPVTGIVYDAQMVSPAALPSSVRCRLAEEVSTLRIQEAAAEIEDAAAGTDRTDLSAFPRPVVDTAEQSSAAWADDVLAVLPDQLIALTVVDPTADVDFLPAEQDREQLADAVGHAAVVTAFVFPESTELIDQLGLPTLDGLYEVVADAESVVELNQRTVPLKPVSESAAFVHTTENRELSGVEFDVERAAFEAGNITIEDGDCQIDPELQTRLEASHETQKTRNELVVGGLIATVGSLPVLNLIVQSAVTTSGFVSPLLFVIAAVCLGVAVSRLGFPNRNLKTLAATG